MVIANGLNAIPQQIVYVNPQTGSDTSGNGTAMNPWATISQANSSITDNAATKPYNIYLTGIATESSVVIKLWISLTGNTFLTSIVASSGITLDATFGTTTAPTVTIANINLTAANLNLGVVSSSGSAFTVNIFNCSFASGSIQGR